MYYYYYCIVLYCIVLYCIVLYCFMLLYIVYTMLRYYVLIKVFSFNSGVMLSSSFSDALLLENVIVIRSNEIARLVSLLGPTSQKQRLVGWLVVLGFNSPFRQYFSLYQAVFQREGDRKEK